MLNVPAEPCAGVFPSALDVAPGLYTAGASKQAKTWLPAKLPSSF